LFVQVLVSVSIGDFDIRFKSYSLVLVIPLALAISLVLLDLALVLLATTLVTLRHSDFDIRKVACAIKPHNSQHNATRLLVVTVAVTHFDLSFILGYY